MLFAKRGVSCRLSEIGYERLGSEDRYFTSYGCAQGADRLRKRIGNE